MTFIIPPLEWHSNILPIIICLSSAYNNTRSLQCTVGFDPTIRSEKSTFFILTVPLEMTSVPTRFGIVRTAKTFPTLIVAFQHIQKPPTDQR